MKKSAVYRRFVFLSLTVGIVSSLERQVLTVMFYLESIHADSGR